jgi:putative restriction endonuclease
MTGAGGDDELRMAMFSHLQALSLLHPEGIPSTAINDFQFAGRQQRLIVQPGIWKPRECSAALTIRTAYRPTGADRPYEDEIGTDGFVRYKWRGDQAQHSDNRALREAMVQQRPLAYFVGVDRGVYNAVFPVFLIAEEPQYRQFVVAVDEAQVHVRSTFGGEPASASPARSYAERLTRLRLHQPIFRARVLRAYRTQCAMCRLRHAPLLDAAHILADNHPRGEPVVPNGVALCKIHHAAFDSNILGIRPDFVVQIRADVLTEQDGPMLRHGLQELHGASLVVPADRRARPDSDRLAERYEAFRQAA